jgi:hypothetical protein
MPQLVPCYFCLSFGFCKVAALRAAGAGADGGSANGKPGAAKQDRAPFGSSGWPGLSVGQNPKAIGFDLMMSPARSGRRSFFVVGAAMGEAWTIGFAEGTNERCRVFF